MSIQRRRFLAAASAGTALGLAGCLDTPGTNENQGTTPPTDASGGSADVGDGELVLATTTSTYDTGLLDHLNPKFEASFGVKVKTVAKGTGASLRTAEDGDADIVLVHARGAEDAFLEEGYGTNRRDVMFNDFVIVGPGGDPAGIKAMGSAADALSTIADEKATFVSRGDDSGTHKKEKSLWAKAGVDPGGEWYQAIGKGMGDTLNHANEVGAYTLADRGTYLSMRAEIDLQIVVQGPLKGGPVSLKNPYGVIPVDPATHGHVNYEAAMAYVGFLTGKRGQGLIEGYTANGAQLFFPNALATEPDFAQYVPQGYSTDSAGSLSTADKRYLHWVETRGPNARG